MLCLIHRDIGYMKKLRSSFWNKSRELIEWCCDEELRVLKQQTETEMNARLGKLTDKFDAEEKNRIKVKKFKSKIKAKRG